MHLHSECLLVKIAVSGFLLGFFLISFSLRFFTAGMILGSRQNGVPVLTQYFNR